jgi:hypothetical protein
MDGPTGMLMAATGVILALTVWLLVWRSKRG